MNSLCHRKTRAEKHIQKELPENIVFKKVKEGLEEFDFIYDKLQSCDQQSQKEKLENDLKKEIKKLQRHREQIKTWMSGNEVKDKKQLIEHRRLIEHEMERFKEVEKIMKTKAFSNEALASTDVALDPRQREKLECAEFIQSMIEELDRQDESIEAQIDQITSSLKKKKSDASKQSQIDALSEQLERHKWHVGKLETILRLLENDNLEVDQINDIKEDIEYYVHSNQESSFVEDDTFYDELGLDELDEGFRVVHAGHDDEDEDDRDEKESKPTTRKSSTSTQSMLPTASSTSQGPAAENLHHVAPPAAAAAPASRIPSASHQLPQLSQNSQTSSPLVRAANLTPAASSSTTPKLKYASVVSTGLPAADKGRASPSVSTGLPRPADSTRESTASPQQFSFLDASNYTHLPDGIRDYVSCLEAAKTRHETADKGSLDTIFPQLESSLLNCPDSYDSDKPRNYQPTNQFTTQTCFPQEPAVEITGSTKLLQKLKIDTLAYCFYYHNVKYKSPFTTINNLNSPGDDYLQYIAAKEFIRRGWKYHKELKTWFFKDGDGWKMFDYKDSWSVKSQPGFSFDPRQEQTL
ncbi:hypothetical protein KL930_003039 [Ogataea haglerorum]|nr:hypothetical protein KL915_003669 [Ogataea haglerorum]KAG7704821.1 hypothetical protein KL950_003994 [Ogataea haglerorum]KAG7719195.1 hypothetical protein KL913_002193 [Ogataea haglerorum]KAG7719982.1 hypothetical protein KL949_001947 [Ogataea haglerorum]KAG7739250.1 hypothetical protein KL932_003344 [Ogataea haglerorum]